MDPIPTEFFQDFIRKHQIAVDNLTEKQCADALRQAIASGDFMRCVVPDGSQCVTYLPWREVEQLRRMYNELIYAVESKFVGETRHETALRYIKEREHRPSEPACEGNSAATPEG